MYKQVLVPDEKNHTFEMPKKFFGKKVEVIVVEVGESTLKDHPHPPKGKKVNVNKLFEKFGAAPNFPSIDEIRTKAWSSKW
jgi:hypothetical protein